MIWNASSLPWAKSCSFYGGGGGDGGAATFRHFRYYLRGTATKTTKANGDFLSSMAVVCLPNLRKILQMQK
jgi:hypothetical protein